MDLGSYANPAQAALALRRALAQEPGNPIFLKGLMELYRQLGRLAEARALGEGHLDQGGRDAEVLRLLALVYAALGETSTLLAFLKGREGEAASAVETGTHALCQGRLDTAMATLDRALELEPENWRAWMTTCQALIHAHRLEEAVDRTSWLREQPIEDEELRAQIGFLKAVALLLDGRLPEGFQWLECRFGMDAGPSLVPLPLAPWQGEDLAGRTIVLQAEQGFGDVFMLVRYASVLAARGAKVLLRPQPGTQDVVATALGLSGLAEGTVELPRNAFQAPVMSLPTLCGTTLDTIPAPVPYLRVPEQVPNREAIDACLAGADQPLRIGLVWAGNPLHNQDRDRSMPPEMLDLLADVPGITWVDLQVMKGPRPSLPMLDLARHFTNFADTAYALERLDGMISVDSGPVHLAGALGRPVWLALAWLPDWRWMLDRKDSPWYPTMELWRQSAPGDWGPVIRGMRERLLAGAFRNLAGR
jgi:tetratricopeptide (TPR) repeat protein